MIIRYDDDISAFLPMAENHLNLKRTGNHKIKCIQVAKLGRDQITHFNLSNFLVGDHLQLQRWLTLVRHIDCSNIM